MTDLSTDIAGLALPNPIVLASGTAMYGEEISAFLDLSGVGALVTKSVLSRPWAGMPPPRGTASPSGLLNSIGLQGDGVAALITDHLPRLRAQGIRVIVSVAGHSIDEYGRIAEALASRAPDVGTVEINISCPNVEDQNRVFARDPKAAHAAVLAVRQALPHTRLLAKLSPDVADIVEIAHACTEAGADVLSLINTVLGATVDTRTLRPGLSQVFGGLSGPAIRPIAVRCIWQVHEALPQVPILGGGGVRTGRDALELTAAGASAVTIGTVNFEEPAAADRITRELRDLLDQHRFTRYRDAIGYAHSHRPPRSSHDDQ